ncbi:ABC transporter G family member 28 [Tetrabaena socialis]|uniref:ABC transporter G family member 28 n=1 Tax=Tetrabaena socialis TaxID=47790 RepID=A0A2J8A509_9CHLO|nr:ABC transporter G family member 28 [Tetrabaena socialis]|eukprot:PNH07622.1 ABC transporter G family member 28 [Tetrabaena socialis]
MVRQKVLLWRESAAGMSTLAYYLSQNIIDQLWVFTAPALSLGVYYYLTLPRVPFSELYVVGVFVCWWASGMAYMVSAVLPPQNVLMAGVFVSLIFGAFLHGLSPSIASARGTLLEGVLGLSYNRWAMEIVTINELKYYQVWAVTAVGGCEKGLGGSSSVTAWCLHRGSLQQQHTPGRSGPRYTRAY